MDDGARWVTVTTTDAVGFRNVHVEPIEDLIKHTHEMHCLCEPRVQWYLSGCYYAVHNSWDEREKLERKN